MTEPGESMEADGEGGSRNSRVVRKLWTLNLEERQFLRGIGEVAYARKTGFSLAVGAAAVWAAAAVTPYPRWFATAVDHRLALASAGIYLALGLLIRRGKGWASLAMMAMITAWIGVPSLTAFWRYGIHNADAPRLWVCSVIVCLACWMLWLRMLWVAYRLERPAAVAGT